jgi:hypothetical protein
MTPTGRPRTAIAMVVVAMAALWAASAFAYFRAEDWLALDLGDRALHSGWHDVWTTLWFDDFYRPLTDLYQASMVGRFGLHAWPYFAALIAMFTAHTALIAWIVRMRGSDRTGAWLAAAAAWSQVNTYAWTALWMSNVGGSLAAGFLLLALAAHHVAVRRAAEGRSSALPMAMGVLAVACRQSVQGRLHRRRVCWRAEGVRWPALTAAERRAVVRSWIAISGAVGLYVLFRLIFMPSPQMVGHYFRLSFGTNWLRNASFFALHLGALPLAALVVSRVLYPAAWRPEARAGDAWPPARTHVLAGLGWTAIAMQVYLPIAGHGYGYLYAPAFGIAYAVSQGLAWAAQVQREARGEARVRLGAMTVIAAWWFVAAVAVGVGLVGNGWPRYRTVARETFATLDRALPVPRPGDRILFLDPERRETLAGRSLFDRVFRPLPQALNNVHYRDSTVVGSLIRGPEALVAAARPPAAEVVLLARDGRLTILRAPSDSARAGRASPGVLH